jgi:hypothetical protein
MLRHERFEQFQVWRSNLAKATPGMNGYITTYLTRVTIIAVGNPPPRLQEQQDGD